MSYYISKINALAPAEVKVRC